MQNILNVKMRCVAFSPSGGYFACGGSNGHVKIFDTNAAPLFEEPQVLSAPRHEFIFKINVTALAFGDGDAGRRRLALRKASRRLRDRVNHVCLLAVGLQNGSIRIIDLEKMDVLLVLEDHKRCITCLAFPVDGSLILASTSADGTCKLWDLWDDGNMFRTIREFVFEGKACNACAWAPDRKSICFAGGPQNAAVWNLEADNLEGRLVGHKHCVTSCDFSHDNSMIATASMDTSVIVWDRKSLQSIRQFWHMGYRPSLIYLGGANGHYVTRVRFSSDNIHLATTCDDRTVRVWDLDRGSQVESEIQYPVNLFVEGGQFTDIDFSPDGSMLAMSVVGPYESNIFALNTPVVRPLLVHLCRSSIRRRMSSEEIGDTRLPGIIKKFLCYEHNNQ